MTITESIKFFLAVHKNTLAAGTIENYGYDLGKFAEWVSDYDPAAAADVGQLQRGHLRAYIDYLMTRKRQGSSRRYLSTMQTDQDRARHDRGLLSLYTIHKYVRSTKRWLTFLAAEEVISSNPGAGVRNVTLPAPAMKSIPTEALQAMLHEARQPPQLVRFDARDAAIAALIGSQGHDRPDLEVGSGELARLTLGDIDRQRLHLVARPFSHSPVDTPFTVTITSDQAAALNRWLEMRPIASSADYVFVTMDPRGEGGRGGQMRNRAIYSAYRKHVDMTPEERATRDKQIAHDAKYTARRLALLLFFLDTGARLGGITGLTKDRLDLANRRAIVLEKGRTVRTVFFSPETAAAVADWLRLNDQETDKVFPIKPIRLRGMFDRLADAAGVDAIHNPHAWRHTFAKMAIMNGADLTMVQRLMGHRSIKITADYYSHYAVDELALIHDRVSPVSSLMEEE
jgi:integrase